MYLYNGLPKKILAQKINSKEMISSIRKKKVSSLEVKFKEIESDLCNNLVHHGGDDRVVHYYPMEHYIYLKEFLKIENENQIIGLFGENICSSGLMEEDVCIGDIVTIGEVKLQVTEPRRPCSTIDISFNQKGVFKEVYNTGKVGWFYRVLKSGKILENDSIILSKRIHKHLNLKFVYENIIHFNKFKNKENVKLILNANELSLRFKNRCEEILK